ncbi:hypothetical protein IV203_011180 [Nitzschia inconspicua]|uniref:Uncharacterized protein n=1 Tax=Nitzschia inconspicua TaxID=303405 RepID=A0A9K3K602_9STRA|nr:hypothetical protein IV203_011180 [Nitzschia inconspicua]
MCNDRPVDSRYPYRECGGNVIRAAGDDARTVSLNGATPKKGKDRTGKHSMCKRLKPETCMDSPKDAASYRQPGIPIPPEVLRLIARGGFLRSQDLGKLLLLSSKSIVTTLTSDFVYNLLYETRLKDRWASPTRKTNGFQTVFCKQEDTNPSLSPWNHLRTSN